MKKIALIILISLLGILFFSLFSQKGSIVFMKFSLKRTVEKSLEGVNGRYAVYIKNLRTGESYWHQEQEIFDAGSLYKLWVMGKIFDKVKAGDLKEDESVEANVPALNSQYNIDPAEADLKEGNLQFSLMSAIEQMITISHNYAALGLVAKTSQEEVQSFIENLNLKNSRMKFPSQTTAEDIGIYLEKVYKGEVVDADYSGKMLEVLSRQTINDRIPKMLPPGTKIAHKTADLGTVEHDAGIVYTEKGDYILVVLTDTEFPDAADEIIADLSLAVFEYFNK